MDANSCKLAHGNAEQLMRVKSQQINHNINNIQYIHVYAIQAVEICDLYS